MPINGLVVFGANSRTMKHPFVHVDAVIIKRRMNKLISAFWSFVYVVILICGIEKFNKGFPMKLPNSEHVKEAFAMMKVRSLDQLSLSVMMKEIIPLLSRLDEVGHYALGEALSRCTVENFYGAIGEIKRFLRHWKGEESYDEIVDVMERHAKEHLKRLTKFRD
jgi:hypothetical protein